MRAPWVCLRVVEEREFLLIRNPLARFPAAMRAINIMLTAAELHRSVDTLGVRNFAKHR